MIIKVLFDIYQLISMLINFLVDLVQDLITVIQSVIQAFEYAPNFLSWLPLPVIGIVTGLFVIVLLYKVLGREG